MPKFHKKPVVIEAFQLGVDPVPDWMTAAVESKVVVLHLGSFDADPCAFIKTKEGRMKADAEKPGCRGDFVIRGVQGEIYPCKPDIFEATYDPVEED